MIILPCTQPTPSQCSPLQLMPHQSFSLPSQKLNSPFNTTIFHSYLPIFSCKLLFNLLMSLPLSIIIVQATIYLLLDNCNCLLAGPSSPILAPCNLVKAARWPSPARNSSVSLSNCLQTLTALHHLAPADLSHLIPHNTSHPLSTPTGLKSLTLFPAPDHCICGSLYVKCSSLFSWLPHPSGLSPISLPQETFPAQVRFPHHAILQHHITLICSIYNN